MSKNQKSNKESKKKALLTQKEKRAVKRAKDTDNPILGVVFDNNKKPSQQKRAHH